MAVADGFHVDSNGNLWLGSNRETFDATTRSEAPFYVYANGDMVANSGTFAGTLSSGISISAPVITGGSISGTSGTFTGNLSGSNITGGSINIGNGTFQVDSSGNLTATSASISGVISAGGAANDINGNSTQISGGKIQANSLDVNSVITSDLSFSNLSIESQDIINTLVDNAILDTIGNGQISDTKLGNISASKITAGTLDATLIGGGSISMSFNINTSANLSGNSATIGTDITVGDEVLAAGTVYGSQFKQRYGSSVVGFDSSSVYLRGAGTTDFKANASDNISYRVLRPNTDNTTDLGESGNRWRRVYRLFESSASDQRLKENIAELTYGLDFINNLEPKEFTWKQWSTGFSCSQCNEFYTTDDGCSIEDCEGTLEETFTDAGENYVFGFLAQDMENYIDDSKTYELLNYEEDKDTYNYSSSNMIAPLVKAIQELSAKNDELESRLAALEG